MVVKTFFPPSLWQTKNPNISSRKLLMYRGKKGPRLITEKQYQDVCLQTLTQLAQYNL